jgi:plasmid stability protein
MGQLLVRQVRDDLIEKMRQRAAANGRSVEAEHRAILEEVLAKPTEPLWVTARRLRQTSGVIGTDSAETIREQRRRRQDRA